MIMTITLLILWQAHVYCHRQISLYQGLVIRSMQEEKPMTYDALRRVRKFTLLSILLNSICVITLLTYTAKYIWSLFA